MAEILLTGGRGFVGTNLARELRSRGHTVCTLDLQHTSSSDDVRADVTYMSQLRSVFANRRFDYVYHMAAEYGRWNGEDHYDNLWRTNVIGTKNILRLQEEHAFRMIFFSSSEVYGDYDGVMSEDVMDRVPIKQLNDYAMTKWVGEMQCVNHGAMYGTECVRVRPSNLYGPHEHYHPYRGVIAIMVYKALQGEPFPVYGSHRRSFGYIDDAVRALANIVDHFVPGEVYNIGGREDWSVSIDELADIVLEVTGADPMLAERRETEKHTTNFKQMDFSKARRDLGFEATVDLFEGINRYVEWMTTILVPDEQIGTRLHQV